MPLNRIPMDMVDGLTSNLAENGTQLMNKGLDVTLPLGTSLTAAKGDGVTDDTSAIQEIVNYCSTNNLKPFFPTKTYLIKSTIIIPSGCKAIDFNFSTFNYSGATGTYCLSGGFTNGITQGYNYANWKNLTINGVSPKATHGMDLTGLKSGLYENILIYGCDTGINMEYSFSSLFRFCTINGCNTGVITGEASNATTFSALSLTSCALGVKLGDSTGGSQCFGVTFNDECEFQSNTTVFELNMIQQASITNAYFEDNALTFKIASNTNANNGVYNFSVENCIIDLGSNKYVNLLQSSDSSRQLYMRFVNNRFMGTLTGVYFDRISGLANYGGWKQLVFKNNTFGTNTLFTSIFPSTFPLQYIESDIPYLPTIVTTNWTVYETVKLFCRGNNEFELTGSVSRVNGTSANNLISGAPYWFFSENITTQALVLQSATGTGGSFKTARIEFKNNQTINLYTADTTDLTNIYLTGTRWTTNA